MRLYLYGQKRSTIIARITDAGPAGVLRDELIAEVKGTRRSLAVMMAKARHEGIADIRAALATDGWRFYMAEHLPKRENVIMPFVARAMAIISERLKAAGNQGISRDEMRKDIGSATADIAQSELRRRGELFYRHGNKNRPSRYFRDVQKLQADERKDPPAKVKALKPYKPKPLTIKKSAAAPSAFLSAVPIIPANVKVQVIPHGQDYRYSVSLPRGGGVITQDWRERRLAAV